MAVKKRLGEMLVEAGIIDETQLHAALGHQRQWGGRLGACLVEMKLASEESIVDALAVKFGFEVARLDQLEPYAFEQAKAILPREYVTRNSIFPIAADTGVLTVAMSDPTNLSLTDELAFKSGRRIKVCIAGENAIAAAVRHHYGEEASSAREAIALDADDGIGAACPKILFAEPDAEGRAVINNVGNELGPTWELHDRGYGQLDRGQYDREEDVWAWCGAAVLLRRRYLDEVGLFDERLFLYAEDTDLAWRGARQGWRYRYVPTSVVRHLHRASSGGQRTPLLDHLNRRNRLVVVTRHGGLRIAAGAWARAVGGIVAAVLIDVLAPLARGHRPRWAPVRRRARAAVDAARLLVGGQPPLP